MSKLSVALAACVVAFGVAGSSSESSLLGMASAHADSTSSHQACPVASPYPGETYESMFGADIGPMLHCLKQRTNVKVVMQINNFCQDTFKPDGTGVRKVTDCAATRAFALGNIRNMIADYEITHGMKLGRDYEIAVIVHSGGGHLMLKKEVNGNPFQAQVEALMDQGVNFYFCLNTATAFMKSGLLTKGQVTKQMIEGVQYTTAGVTALADFQRQGYLYVQP